MSKRYILSLVAANRTGILAAVTTALAELGGDIREISVTVVEQFFTIILAADFPEHRDPEVIKGHLEGVCRPFGIEIILKDPALEHLQKPPPEGAARFFLTLTGQDAPGVVAQISGKMARERIDITDLYGLHKDNGNSFAMVFELAIPAGVNAEALRSELEQWGQPIGLTAALQPERDYYATRSPRALRFQARQ